LLLFILCPNRSRVKMKVSAYERNL
jgi:hypothetical protein